MTYRRWTPSLAYVTTLKSPTSKTKKIYQLSIDNLFSFFRFMLAKGGLI
jgi:hypothetical protein